jgi:hypothetical protein
LSSSKPTQGGEGEEEAEARKAKEGEEGTLPSSDTIMSTLARFPLFCGVPLAASLKHEDIPTQYSNQI